MLNHSPKPLPAVLAEPIRAALNTKPILDFLNVLAARAALATAEGGNLMLSAEEGSNRMDATAQFEEAAFYNRMITVINECRNPESKLEDVKIERMPVVTTST